MESLRGPISPHFLGENMNSECLEEGNALNFAFGSFLTAESMRLAEPFSSPSYGEDKMPVLQMPSTKPNFQLLLQLQQLKKPNTTTHFLEPDSRIPPLELESCVTHVSESHSPVKSETKDHPHPHSSPFPEVVSSCCNLEPNSPEIYKHARASSSQIRNQTNNPQFVNPSPAREKKKRKRARPFKNSEDVESQRMTHIAVERNRRKQMNAHLTALRSLMPSSYTQRGDQASIVGGAIDFIKELEQLLQSLQAQKQMRKSAEGGNNPDFASPFSGFFTSPNYTAYSSQQPHLNFISNSYLEGGGSDSTAAESVANIEVTVIQTHASLKILSRNRPGQLLRAIGALEDLFLTILHLNVTSLEHAVLYSFSLKIEEGCRLGSADEIASAVYQIFNFIESN